jgi:hypothetical protein
LFFWYSCFIEEKMDATMDEPMDVDTSQLMPQTPLNNQRIMSRRPEEPAISNEENPKQVATAKPPISGAKIVKPIRPGNFISLI